MSKGKEKFDKVMHEWGQNKLRSSSGHKVKYPSDRQQAIAIAYSEARSVEPSYGNGGKVKAKTEKMETGGRVLSKVGQNPLIEDKTFEEFEAAEQWEHIKENYKNNTIDDIIFLTNTLPETDNDRQNMESILPYLYNQEDLDKYAKEVGFVHGAMARGGFFDFGRPNSAIARDRKYLSQEPHEQAYAPNRKKVPHFYKSHAKGGQTDNEVKKLYDKALDLLGKHINNGGSLDFSEKEYGYLNDDLDAVAIGYFNEKPDGDYQKELADENYKISEKDAIETLEHRIENIESELQFAKGGVVNYSVSGGGLAKPVTISASSKDEAIEKAQAMVRHAFGSVPKSHFSVSSGGSTMASGGGVEEHGEVKGYSGGYDVTVYETEKGNGEVQEGGLPYAKAVKMARQILNDENVFEVAVIVTDQSNLPSGEGTIRWISRKKSSGGSTMASGGQTQYYDNGGMTDEKKKIEDKIKLIKASLLNAATPELVKQGYRTKLSQLEAQLAGLQTPAPEPVRKEVSVVQEEPIVEARPIAEAITEAIVEEVQKQEKDDVALPEGKAEEGTKKLVKAHIEGDFEGTVEIGGKSARNITIPGNKTYWINIEPVYRNLIRNTLDYNDLDYTSKTLEDKTYQVLVNSPELLERVFKIYNMKRAHKNDAIIEDITTISGKYKKGGKIWIAKADKKEKTLRNKAMRMGLIKGKDEKLTDKDLNKIAKQSKGWKKRVEIIRAVNEVKNKK